MDNLQEMKRRLAELEAQKALASETGVLPELEFSGSKESPELKKTPQQMNYDAALKTVLEKEAEKKALQKMSEANTDSLTDREIATGGSVDPELEDLASIVATRYRPSPDVERRIINMREKDPVKFRKLEELIRTKIDQKK